MTDTKTLTTEQPDQAALKPAVRMPAAVAHGLAIGGGALTAASAFLAWTYSSSFPGDLTISGYPGGLQWLTLTAGLLTALMGVIAAVPGLRVLAPGNPGNATLLFAVGGVAVTWFTLIAIAVQLHGLVNLTSGGWVAGVASLIALVGTLGLPRAPGSTVCAPTRAEWLQTLYAGAGLLAVGYLLHLTGNGAAGLVMAGAGVVPIARLCIVLKHYTGPTPTLRAAKRLPVAVDVVLMILMLALALEIFAYGVDTPYGQLFVGFLAVLCFSLWALSQSGLLRRATEIFERNRAWAAVLGFLTAAAFVFVQQSDADAALGVNVLIFAATALGLNVVVGLAGLLDLGYVAFLGVGAYAAALVSGAVTSSVHATFPFWAAALTGAAVSGIFGVLLGAPTLRVRGDYLAIVTLGFGEIFRIVVSNLDGVSGPNVTGGPNGIVNIPDLSILGFNLGNPHTILGATIGRFANYFWLMLIIMAIIMLVFSRAADSRIGRAWVAIREDETAATAMGINGFRFKLLAFALGAALAGLAGTVMAHVNFSVVPDPFVFAGPVPPNSAFLLAAVVIGGMGTVSGPIVGATLFYLLQQKLTFLQSNELLIFGVALILFMRLRPEGIIASRRRQLEFHEAEDAPAAQLSTAGA
ncbi:branched-chain amino acid ABC transporter permease [Streptacidiphilus jiangxiensis]|uniref:Branched-chain amino acid transport system permease protein n=1 Tax=Streptacidiphilus jiangxiensis TaxID=235985 RepID=A0A1H7SKU4_STRJI|nr:branched-chain amino acid transport system permease protein [Streptacidiphilus jiangxiensis]